MDTKLKVTAQGVMFNNRLYRSDALKALVGQFVKLKFDGPAGDRGVVIWEDSVIEVRLWKRGNPPNALQASGVRRRKDGSPQGQDDRLAGG